MTTAAPASHQASRHSPRIAAITGGTRGIGLGIARCLARDGWHLALCGRRSEDAVRGVIDELQGLGADVLYRATDLARTKDHATFISAISERWSAIHALVNNAGRGPRVRADLLDATEESFEEVLRTNLQGPYFLTQQIARRLIAQRRENPSASAAVVFVTSVSATMASLKSLVGEE